MDGVRGEAEAEEGQAVNQREARESLDSDLHPGRLAFVVALAVAVGFASDLYAPGSGPWAGLAVFLAGHWYFYPIPGHMCRRQP